MSGPQRQKRLVLDRQHLISLVCDPGFYAACPAFAWMRETALTSARLYTESKKRRCCGGDWGLLRPVVDGWFASLKAQHAEDRASVEPVRDYLARKKGYRPTPLVIYYRSSSKGRPSKFQF